MPTSNERKALWFLSVVVLSGSVVRMVRARSIAVGPESAAALTSQIRRVDSAASAPRSRSKASKSALPPTAKAPRAPMDLDRADAAAIESLPGIGPALAQRIVRHRDSAGPFGGMGAFCDVRGIGPALAQRLRPLVTFTGPQRPVSDACGDGSVRPRKASVTHRRNPR